MWRLETSADSCSTSTRQKQTNNSYSTTCHLTTQIFELASSIREIAEIKNDALPLRPQPALLHTQEIKNRLGLCPARKYATHWHPVYFWGLHPFTHTSAHLLVYLSPLSLWALDAPWPSAQGETSALCFEPYKHALCRNLLLYADENSNDVSELNQTRLAHRSTGGNGSINAPLPSPSIQPCLAAAEMPPTTNIPDVVAVMATLNGTVWPVTGTRDIHITWHMNNEHSRRTHSKKAVTKIGTMQ